MGAMPFESTLNTIISNGVSLSEADVNRGFQAEQAQLNRDFQHGEAELQRDWTAGQNELSRQGAMDLQTQNQDFINKMWQANNSYNTPYAQKQRLKAAGINPFLAQSSVGSGESSLAGSSPQGAPPLGSGAMAGSVGTPSGSLAQLTPFTAVRDMLAGKQVQAQLQSSEGQYIKDLADSFVTLGKEFGPEQANKILNNILPGLGSASADGMSQTFRLLGEQVQSQHLDNLRKKMENDLLSKFGSKHAQSILDRVDIEANESAARIGKMASDARVNESEIRELATRCAKNLAEAGLASANAETINHVRQYLVGQMRIQFNQMDYDWTKGASQREFWLSPLGQEGLQENAINSREGNTWIRNIQIFNETLGDYFKIGMWKHGSGSGSRTVVTGFGQ